MMRLSARFFASLLLMLLSPRHRAAHALDFVIGSAVTWAGGNDPSAEAKLRGYEIFLRSVLHSAPGAIVVFIADDPNWNLLPPDLRSEPRVVRVTVGEVINELPGAHVSAVWKRTTVQFGRYYLYPAAMELARKRFGLAVPSAFSHMHSHGNASGGCHSHVKDPFVLFSDTRDALFQRNPFEIARQLARQRRQQQQLSSHTECGLPPLFVAEEPTDFPVLQDPINNQWLASCFRREDVAHMTGKPIICSGTTMGSWTAMATYARAMVQLLPYCLTAQKVSAGIDQSVHIMAMYAGTHRLARAAYASDYETNAPHPFALHPSYADRTEDAMQLFVRTARTALLRLVDLVFLPYREGLICTVGLILRNANQSLVLQRRESSTASVVDARGETASITARGIMAATISAVDLSVNTHVAYDVMPFVGASQACALVHQYDRHALPIMIADVRYRGRSRAAEYCQEDTSGPAHVRDCWSYNSFERGDPPIDRSSSDRSSSSADYSSSSSDLGGSSSSSRSSSTNGISSPISSSGGSGSNSGVNPISGNSGVNPISGNSGVNPISGNSGVNPISGNSDSISNIASSHPLPPPPHVIYINLDHRTDRRAKIEARLTSAGWTADRVHRLSATNNATHGLVGCNDSHLRALRLAMSRGWCVDNCGHAPLYVLCHCLCVISRRFRSLLRLCIAGWKEVLIVEDDIEFRGGGVTVTDTLRAFLHWADTTHDEWTAVLIAGIRLDLRAMTPVTCPRRYLDTSVLSAHSYTHTYLHTTPSPCGPPPPPALKYVSNVQSTAGYMLSSRYYGTAEGIWRDAAEALAATPDDWWYSLDQAWKSAQGPHVWYGYEPVLAEQGASFSDITRESADYRASYAVWEAARASRAAAEEEEEGPYVRT